MFIILVATIQGPRPIAARPSRLPLKAMKSLAAVMVPAHGFVGSVGLSNAGAYGSIRSQIWVFFKQLARGCAWAAAIAAGMLVYTTFTQKWKERGYPTIPISALMAVDQMVTPRSPGIPLGPSGPTMYGGGRTTQSSTQTTTSTRQTSLLDMDEFEG